MKISKSTWIAIVLFVVWLVLAWFVPGWLGLKAPTIYYLRAALAVLGVIGLVGYFLLRPKHAEEPTEGAAATASAEIDYNFNEASKRMQSAGVKRLGSLPALFVLGEAGSAKTSIIAKSGLEPELLAGQAYQDYLVAPTTALNLWYGRKTLFIDPAGVVVTDAVVRKKLFRKFLPVKLTSVFGTGTPPSRSVIFTVDCETFLQAGGAEALGAKAREFQTVLNELSHELGSSFPVYVLFTKADRIPYFGDYVDQFTEAEAGEVFGVTLPVQVDSGQGVYAEQQARKLTEAFQELYYSLTDKRPPYLAREHDPAKLPNIYEFAREFSKLRTLLVQFLLELCRPSQLGTTPFLRGFYFTGVRAVSVTDLAAPAQQVSQAVQNDPFDAGATRIFSARGASRQAAEPLVRETGSRKIPQWIFLAHLFTDVILVDQPATSVTQRNVKVNFMRRLLLACAAVLALLMAIWWLVSYNNNRALVNEAVASAQAVPSAPLPSGQLASLDSLQRLNRIRTTLATLNDYHDNGAPWGYRALLYTGDDVREPLRTTYYALFRKVLLGPTQDNLLAICSKPDTYEAQGYRYVYDTLKAYLITTNHHEKSTQDFLTPTLLQHWQNGQQVDNERLELARQNFDFYATDLVVANPYPRYSTPDGTAVETARAYLKRFAQEERIYQAMLLAAAKDVKPIIFNVDYPGSAQTVLNTYKVDPAFTKTGFANFQKQLKDPDKYFAGEEWVLGPQAFADYDKQKLVQDLTKRYQQDFVKTWREYLRSTAVVNYKDVPDAASKLQQMTGPQSALLQVICVASDNTAVADKDVAQVFQPTQFVTPPGCSHQLAAASNNDYMGKLIALQSALQSVGPIENADPNNVTQALNQESQAEVAVGVLARNFSIDQGDTRNGVDSRTAQILRDPLLKVSGLMKGAGAGPVNAAAGGVCASISPMLRKYPFNPRSTTDADINEVTDFLKPGTGKLWQLYNEKLKAYLTPSGSDYVPATGQQLKVTPAFLSFFNRAAHMSQALFKGDSQTPNFTFAMQPIPAPDVAHVTLTIDGQTLSTDVKNGGKAQTFTWPGGAQGVYLGVKFGNSPEFQIAQTSGVWAVWHFLDSAEKWQPLGTQYDMEWVQKTSAGVTNINGHPAAVKFALDPQGAQVFRPQYFSGMGCISKAVE